MKTKIPNLSTEERKNLIMEILYYLAPMEDRIWRYKACAAGVGDLLRAITTEEPAYNWSVWVVDKLKKRPDLWERVKCYYGLYVS